MACEMLYKLLNGDFLFNNGGKKSSEVILKEIEEKVLGFYFSCYWCYTDRSFSLQLTEFYNKINSNRKQLEILFISLDHNRRDFDTYFSHMPWLTLPFEDTSRKHKICRKFHKGGVPALILVNPKTGHIITTSGKDYVLEDLEGKKFPWYPSKLSKILENVPLISSNNTCESYADIRDSFKGLYFASQWCPPCRSFTPVLCEAYQNLKQRNQEFEVIFISSDRSKESFDHFKTDMPWKSIPYEYEDTRLNLRLNFSVQAIPSLIILDKDDNIVTEDGRGEILENLDGQFPWRPRLVEELSNNQTEKLYEEPSLVLFLNKDADIEEAEDLLWSVAEEYYDKYQNSDDRTLHFFYAIDPYISKLIRDVVGLEQNLPLATILDLSENKYYLLVDELKISVEVLKQFIKRFLTKDLAFNVIQQ